MSQERHSRVKRLFLEVCDLEPRDRVALLAPLDEPTRCEVAALLAIHDGDTAEDGVVPGLGDGAGLCTEPGSTPAIAGYQLAKVIGEGGMGRVYEAEQQRPIKRRVAVKVLMSGLATRDVVARFESERQALALMRHPNIARVFDAGTTDEGHPFFAMELVEGEAISSYCHRHRLSVAARLALFRDVCHGVQHAHQRGVLHRDLKPSNLLVSRVDDRPSPVIIDFGISKALSAGVGESTVETVAGQLIGTPAYMSPEQLSLTGADLDTRTDVYSLGVILYELLTGERPFEPGAESDFDELRDRIRRVDPIRPSSRVSGNPDAIAPGAAPGARGVASKPDSIAPMVPGARRAAGRRLRGDLDWIILKALAKDRSHRYASVSELDADIERHLEGRPVLAGPPSTLYRVQKFVRRHRLGVAAGVVVGLALLLGLAGTSMGLVQARQAEQTAKQQARTAQEVSRFLVELFRISDPAEARGEVIDAREILERGARRIEEELGEEPLIRAALMRTMGEVYRNLGLLGEAEPLLEGAVELQVQELGEDHVQVAASRLPLGRLYHSQGKLAEAEVTLEKAVEVLRHSSEADEDGYAWALAMLGAILRDRADYEAARLHLERSVEIRERLFGASHLNTAWSHYHLAWLETQEAHYEVARTIYERVLPVFEAQLGEVSPAVAWCLNDLGAVLMSQGEYADARAILERAIAVNEKVLGSDHPDLAAPLQNLAGVLWGLGHEEDAIRSAERAVRLREQNLGPEHPELASSLGSLGYFLLHVERLAEAEVVLQRTLGMIERTLGADHPTYAIALGQLAALYRRLGDGDQAGALLERALSLQEAALGPGHHDLAGTLSNLARLLAVQGSPREALPHLERALEIREKVLGQGHVEVGLTLCTLADLYRLSGDPVTAEVLIERGLGIVLRQDDAHISSFDERLVCLFIDAALRASRSRIDEADASFQKARALMEEHAEGIEPDHLFYEAGYWALRGDRERALEKLRQAIESGFRSPWLAQDSDLASLRGETEFERLLQLAAP